MAKYCGLVAFAEQFESAPDVWKKCTISRQYRGDVLKTSRRYEDSTETTNGKISTSDRISIIADAYAIGHFYNILWIEYMGVKWVAREVEVSRPRLIITLGGLYNGSKQN